VLLRVLEQGGPAAGDDVDFVRRHLGELMYDLRCRRGHRTVQTMPAIVRAMRQTPGGWVPIR
jgi:hypothetical protein